MKITKIHEWFKEKHTKNLKMTEITFRLNIEFDIVPNQVKKLVLMGPIALREPKICP